MFYRMNIIMPASQELQEKYIRQLTEKEQKTYNIAKEHLGSSFNLEKSIGFQEWLKKKPNEYISK
jgi:hypothetical protein